MAPGSGEQPGAELCFRGRREVWLVGGADPVRRLAGPDGVETYLLGSAAGAEGPDRRHEEPRLDAQGRFTLLRHDRARRTLAIRGDRHGFQPLYQRRCADRLLLSTRIGPLVEWGGPCELDLRTLADFVSFGFSFGEKTLASGVSSLGAAMETTIDLDTLASTATPLWDPTVSLRDEGRPLADVQEELVGLFLEGVERCLAGSETAAVAVSGGLDTRCVLAGALASGRAVRGYHVSLPGSRAGRYARRIASRCGIPLLECVLDDDFARTYPDLVRRVVAITEGMKFGPQPEMLWLRDQVELPTVVLHGAYGELSKLGQLRDFRLDTRGLTASRDSLAGLLWERFRRKFPRNPEIFRPPTREEISRSARASLEEHVEALDADLDVPRALQLLYLREFPKMARYGHLVWAERLPTWFPFLHPPYVDLLLRVRMEDRREAHVQRAILERLRPELLELPDENTGTKAGASRLLRAAVRYGDLARIALLGSTLGSGHSDLPSWLATARDEVEAALSRCGDDPLFDTERLREGMELLTRVQRTVGPRRLRLRHEARAMASALEAFLIFQEWRRGMGESVAVHAGADS